MQTRSLKSGVLMEFGVCETAAVHFCAGR
ncbi:hypothetical protein AGR1C_Lc30092 [Agrobacterium fabacearum TT111]|nr:hypothetical protein AGR1C_Lc30092 [Agrobacterium fabacearum TT111]